MKWILVLSLSVLASSLAALSLSNLEIDLETGLVITGHNDVAIPGSSGDKFSLKDDLRADDDFFFRLRLNYAIASRHELSLLYAPLTVKSAGKFDQNIDFFKRTFNSGEEIDATYIFNSYRLTYKYRFFDSEKWRFKIGFTAKIREAEIKLKSESITASKTNVGFVPIIYFSANYQLNDRVNLGFSGDALAAPQGRAEDVLAAVFYRLSPSLQLKAGYRLLEGGSDNDEVYTFALFHYALLGLKYRF